MFMKKLMVALIFGLVLAPFSAWGQKWIEPYTDTDGTQVEGHWQTPEDLRKDRYSTPGKINPYTGQFNPYTGSSPGPQSVTPTPGTPAPATPTPPGQNPYYPQPDYKYQPNRTIDIRVSKQPNSFDLKFPKALPPDSPTAPSRTRSFSPWDKPPAG